jgi:hypothetical protein
MEVQEFPTHLIIGGEKFMKLSPNDRARILGLVKEKRVTDFKKVLQEGGITGEEYVNEVDALMQTPFADNEWFKFISSAEGRYAVFLTACRKATNDEDVAVRIVSNLTLDLSHEFQIVAKLAGVRLEQPDPKLLKRQRYASDLVALQIGKDEILERLAKWDAENDIEGQDPRPSAAGSSSQ